MLINSEYDSRYYMDLFSDNSKQMNYCILRHLLIFRTPVSIPVCV